jgi:hypothetical protein
MVLKSGIALLHCWLVSQSCFPNSAANRQVASKSTAHLMRGCITTNTDQTLSISRHTSRFGIVATPWDTVMRWPYYLITLLALAVPAGAKDLNFIAGPSDTTFQTLKIGAGGYVTGLNIAMDGTKVIRTDTYGAYLFDTSMPNTGNIGGAGAWRQLVTANSMSAPDGRFGRHAGVYEIAIAPSDSRRVYTYFNGYVYKSIDRGQTFTRTAFTNVPADTFASDRYFGRFMAVDPVNPDVLYVGTPKSGVFVTIDGGGSFSHIAKITNGVPPAIAGILIAFDPSSGVAGGKTQGIYISSYGTGVFHSTDAGTNWTLTSSGPTTHFHMVCGVDGVLWLTDNSRSKANIWRYQSGSWTHLSAAVGYNATTWQSIAPDPANAGHVYFVADGGGLGYTANNASTNITNIFNPEAQVSQDIPWLTDATNNHHFMAIGDAAFDPSGSNLLYASSGIGVWHTNPPTAAGNFNWNSQSSPIEQLVANWIISPPNGVPLGLVFDRVVFRFDNLDRYPSVHGAANPSAHAIVHGWSGDWASSHPSTIVIAASGDGTADESSISSDGGVTWTQWLTRPPSVPSTNWGGSIAASTRTNWVFIPSNNTPHAYYTEDGAATWKTATIPEVPTSGETGWGFAYFLDRQIVCADRVNANTFYAYNNGASGNGKFAGIYKSIDSGANWTKVHSGVFSSYGIGNFSATLKCVPGQAGNLFYTGGPIGSPVNRADQLIHSTDGGTTWAPVANMLAVTVGFGKAAPGRSYPAIYVVGFLRGAYGIYRSIDNSVTWTLINNGYPLGSFDLIKTLEGDANTYGTVYIGFHGSGFAYGVLR